MWIEIPRHGPLYFELLLYVKVFKQSQRNLGVNFISRADQGGHLHVQRAQSGPPVENGTDGAAEQEKEVPGVIRVHAVVYKSKKSKKQADEKHPEFACVNKSKIKEKQEAPTIPTYATVDESQKFQEVPPDYAEKDKFITKKKKIGENIYAELLDEPKKVCILVFLLYYSTIYHLQV